MEQEISSKHLEALTLLSGVGREVRVNVLFILGQEDLLNAALDLVKMGIVNRRTQPDYTMPGEDEVYYSLSETGKENYQSVLDHFSEKLGH